MIALRGLPLDTLHSQWRSFLFSTHYRSSRECLYMSMADHKITDQLVQTMPLLSMRISKTLILLPDLEPTTTSGPSRHQV